MNLSDKKDTNMCKKQDINYGNGCRKYSHEVTGRGLRKTTIYDKINSYLLKNIYSLNEKRCTFDVVKNKESVRKTKKNKSFNFENKIYLKTKGVQDFVFSQDRGCTAGNTLGKKNHINHMTSKWPKSAMFLRILFFHSPLSS